MSVNRIKRISQNLLRVSQNIRDAALRSNRDPDEITLVVVTKTWSSEIICVAADLGLSHFGENRIQEAAPKIEQIRQDYDNLSWHMIGHLQSNKARSAVEYFDFVQSIDSLKIAQKISNHATELQKNIDVLLEINISGESTKFGIDPEDVFKLAKEVKGLPYLDLKGLMTIGPMTDDIREVRKSFRRMKKIFDILRQQHSEQEINVLSMGMSDDYEIAIEEGSTMVRLGRAIFGSREH